MTSNMFASIRKYSGRPLLADELLKRQNEIKSVLEPVSGFRGYYLIKTGDGTISMTVCDNRAGVEESDRVESTWLKDKLPTFATPAPQVTTGEVLFHVNLQPALVSV
jgi:hypothetical protein